MEPKTVVTDYSDYIQPATPVRDRGGRFGNGRDTINELYRTDAEDNGFKRPIPQAYMKSPTNMNPVTTDIFPRNSPYSMDENERPSSPRFLGQGNEKLIPIHPTPPPPPGRFKRFWAHVKRHWILYTVGNVVFTAIALTLLFLVILPAIVQHQVNSNKLPIISAALTNPTPDNITMSLHTQLKSPGGITAKMDAQMLGLYNSKDDPNPFIQIPIPEQTLKGTKDIIITNVTRPILNQTAFGDFLRNALNTRNFTIYVKSKTVIRLTSVLHYDVNLNKGIKVPGLNKLDGFSVTSVGLTAAGISANVSIPNASPFTLELGNVTQNLYSGTTKLGTGVIPNMVLFPYQNSTFPLVSTVDTSSALQNISGIISSQGPSIASGRIALTTTGNKTEYNGVEIPYYDTALSNLRLTAEIPISELLGGLNSSLGGILGGANGTNSSLGGVLGPLLNGANGTGSLTNATGLSGLLGLLGSQNGLQSILQGILQGMSSEANGNLGGIFSGLLGTLTGGQTTTTKSKVKRIVDLDVDLNEVNLDDSTVLTG